MEPPDDLSIDQEQEELYRNFSDNFTEENRGKLRILAEKLLEFSPINQDFLDTEYLINKITEDLEETIFPNYEFNLRLQKDIFYDIATTIFNNDI